MDKNSEKEVRKGFYYDIMDSNHYVISTKLFRVNRYDKFGHLYSSLSNIILTICDQIEFIEFWCPF